VDEEVRRNLPIRFPTLWYAATGAHHQ